MPTVQAVLDALEDVAPSRYAFDFDRVGLQVGDPAAPVTRAVISLDRSLAAIAEARSCNAELLISHHPLIFTPLGEVTERRYEGRAVSALIRGNLAFIAAHTNWDSAWGGINDALAARLGLSDVVAFGSAALVPQLRLVITCSADAADSFVSAAQAGGARNPLSLPDHGSASRRVQMDLPADRKPAVLARIQQIPMAPGGQIDFSTGDRIPEQPAGRLGRLQRAHGLAEFAAAIDVALGTRSLAWGAPDTKVQRIALVGGAADGEWRAAQQSGADVLVTGEVKQQVALEAAESGFAIIAAGHYATEQPGCEVLRDRLAETMPAIDWRLFAPAPGAAGRPL